MDYTGSWTAWKFFFDAVIRVIKRGVGRPILSFNGRHVEKNIQREEGRNNVQRTLRTWTWTGGPPEEARDSSTKGRKEEKAKRIPSSPLSTHWKVSTCATKRISIAE